MNILLTSIMVLGIVIMFGANQPLQAEPTQGPPHASLQAVQYHHGCCGGDGWRHHGRMNNDGRRYHDDGMRYYNDD